MEDAKKYVIVEEVEFQPALDASGAGSSKGRHGSCIVESKRVLKDDEIVYLAQSAWKGKGLFRLVVGEELPTTVANTWGQGANVSRDLKPKVLARLTRTAKGSLKKLHRLSRMASTKSKSSSTERESSPGSQESDPSPGRPFAISTSVTNSPAKRAVNISALPERASFSVDQGRGLVTNSQPNLVREVCSEGDGESDQQPNDNQSDQFDSQPAADDPEVKQAISSMSRLKRLSIKRWKVFR